MTDELDADARPSTGAGTPATARSSREIHWWPVYVFLAPFLGEQPPIAPGTSDWAQLADDDPDKWRALLWAAVWWLITEETRQDAIEQAGQAISVAEDWTAVARTMHRRAQWERDHPWARPPTRKDGDAA